MTTRLVTCAKFLAVFIAGVSAALPCIAQPYTIPLGNAAPDVTGIDPTIAVYQGTSKWGDYDKDGFIDFILTGRTVDNNLGFEPLLGALFKGISPTSGGASISYIQYSIIEAVWLSDAEWGDFDNDGDLDFALIGSNTVERPYSGIAKVYRNEGVSVGIPSFTPIDLPVPGVYSGSVEWGDVDNDGDLDLLLTGVSAPGVHHTSLIRNDNSTFFEVVADLPDIGFGDARFVDIDGDADLDIALTGALGNNISTAGVFRNGGNLTFSLIPNTLTPVLFGSVDAADYDEDGDQDILIAGGEVGPLLMVGSSSIYDNDGTGTLTVAPRTLVSLYNGEAGFVDYDNDGDTDIYTTGSQHPFTQGTTVMNASVNDGAAFVRTNLLTSGLGAAPFPGVKTSTIAFGDYDRDADLDIMLTGITNDSLFMAIYGNLGPFNTRPREPDSLASIVNGTTVDLSWSAPVDGQTASVSMTYNVRIGSAPGASDIVSPPATLSTGNLAIPRNASITTAGWTISNLSSGTYYWSVQAVDAGFLGSRFATEQQFVIP